MAGRPIWRGHLRLALVSCPVALHPTLHASTGLHFHMINPATGHRVRTILQDAETDEVVDRRDLVKGYEFKKDHYLLLAEEDFEAARVASSATMAVEKFVDADSIDPIFYDTSYYLAPDGEAGRDVYAVLRDAIAKSRRVGLARVVIARRERVVAVAAIDHGLLAHTLHEARDLTDAHELFADTATVRPDPEMVALATQLIDRQTGRYDPADMADRYQARLRAVIDARLKGEGFAPEPDESDPGNVVDLMAALRGSLDQGRGEPKAARGAEPKNSPQKSRQKKSPATGTPGRKRA